MTREEAIKWIEMERDYVDAELATRLVEALDMAIEALKGGDEHEKGVPFASQQHQG